ncbi:hypothetical protein [Thalassobius sp. I31.1]|uniref:hypothetical protein n=1 Tax=Thalassobius sp. I31.1 TaxID=2109912 RepID=UPI001300BCC6|nr:hypothetical protein [Thalassobius sp. I31.1]
MSWEYYSPGFAANSSTGAVFCRELLSSGSDDSAMVLMFMIMILPFIFRLARFRYPPKAVETSVFAVCVLLVIGALYLASLDCAQVFYTAFVVPDFMLLAALVSLAGAVWSIYRLRT